jgi:hypothetical protein
MPYVNKPRPYKKEYQQDLNNGISGPDSRQSERQRARKMFDKLGIDRKGKDIDHVKPLRAGGKSTRGNLRLRSKKANESDNGEKPR